VSFSLACLRNGNEKRAERDEDEPEAEHRGDSDEDEPDGLEGDVGGALRAPPTPQR